MKFLTANSNTRIFNRFCALAAAMLLSHAMFAQPPQTEAEKLLNGTPQTTPPARRQKNAPKVTAGKTSKKVTRGTPKSQNNTALANIKRRSRVTFYTGSPEVELLLDGNAIGTSGKDTRLIVVVDDGEHKLTAKKDGKDLNFSQLVSISTKQITFDVADALNRVVNQVPTENRKPEETAAKTENSKSVDGGAILEAYKDPQRTASVTVGDWDAIYKQSMTQMLSGNTKNDIEALASFAKGQIMLGAGNKNESISAFNAAIVFLPDSALTHYGLGLALQGNNQLTEAAVEYQKAIRLEDKFALPYKQMGDILLAQGKNKEAAFFYQRAKSFGFNTPEINLGLASAQLKNKNCTEAIKVLQVLETESPSANVYLTLGECYLEQKKAFSAIDSFKKAVELEPNSPMAHFRLGETYLDEKENDKAKESLERALALDIDGKIINRKVVQELIGKARKRIK